MWWNTATIQNGANHTRQMTILYCVSPIIGIVWYVILVERNDDVIDPGKIAVDVIYDVIVHNSRRDDDLTEVSIFIGFWRSLGDFGVTNTELVVYDYILLL